MEKYDVILTMGNGLTKVWSLPPIVKSRLEYIAELYRKRVARKILVSGGYSISWDHIGIKPPTTEAGEMKKKLVELGVASDDILVEERSRDTIGNIYFSKVRYLDLLGLRNILVVCTDFHLKRIMFLAGKILGPEYHVTYQTRPSESMNDKEFMQMQDDVLKAQSAFLEDMKDGEDSYLKEKLYQDQYYKYKRREKLAQATMRGVK